MSEITLKLIKYSIFGVTHIFYMADIALQAIYEIIALAIPTPYSKKQMSCAKPGYIAIMADSCTVLTSFEPITLGL